MSEKSAEEKKLHNRIAELEAEIKQLKSRKKYSLVWEDKPEDVVEQCKEQLPVLEEVDSRAILDGGDKPTNILIEGDNYHSLSVLSYTHQGKVDVIYIDPPYNRGKNDFRYNDRYVDEEDSYRHGKWLSFMYKRLNLAKELLKSTGFIFISIDDHEQASLKLLCDEIFGEENFIQNFMWLHGKGKKDRWSRTMQQYILCYAKKKESVSPWGLVNTANYNFQNPDKDPRGGWFSGSVSFSENRSNRKHQNYFTIESPSGIKWTRQWQKTKEEMEELLSQEKIFFGYPPEYNAVPRIKIFPGDVSEQIPPNIIDNVGTTREAQSFLDELLGKNVFDYPKPVNLIKHLLGFSQTKKSIVLDFMAGSGTTGHAVLELNKEDGGNRQFILCTNNENKIAEEVTYPRMEKVIKGYGDVEGILANMRYFKTSFVDKTDVSDDVRKTLVTKSTEMICIKESTYDKKYDNKDYKIYTNNRIATGILFNLNAIDAFKSKLDTIGQEAHIYVFSLSNDTYESDFQDLEVAHTLSPIPESIMEVYRKIFK